MFYLLGRTSRQMDSLDHETYSIMLKTVPRLYADLEHKMKKILPQPNYCEKPVKLNNSLTETNNGLGYWCLIVV